MQLTLAYKSHKMMPAQGETGMKKKQSYRFFPAERLESWIEVERYTNRIRRVLDFLEAFEEGSKGPVVDIRL
jgi:hypothetical protein